MEKSEQTHIGGKVLISFIFLAVIFCIWKLFRKSPKKTYCQRHPCVEIKFGKIFTEAYIAPIGSVSYCARSVALKAGCSVRIQKAVGNLGSLKNIYFIGRASVEITISGRRINSEIYIAEDSRDYLPLVLAEDILKRFQAIKIQEGEKKIHFGNIIVPFIYKQKEHGNVFSIKEKVEK